MNVMKSKRPPISVKRHGIERDLLREINLLWCVVIAFAFAIGVLILR